MTAPGKFKRYSHYASNVLVGKPLSVSLELTYRCDLRCVMCKVWRKAADTARDELTTEELFSVIDQLYDDLGIWVFRLVGAEPFARKDLYQIIEYIKRKPYTEVHIVTNGGYIDEKSAARFVELGVDYYKVSIDGIGEVHDRVRGKEGCYDKAIAGIRAINKAKEEAGIDKPNIHILSIVTYANEDEFGEVFKLRDELKINNFNLGPAWQLDAKTVAASTINGEQVATDRFVPDEKSWIPSDNVQAKIAAADDNPLKASGLSKITSALISPFTRKIRYTPAWNCHSRIHIIVDPVGDLIICPVLDGYSIGNVRNQSLKRILSGKRRAAFTKRLQGDPLPTCDAICGGHQRQEAPRADIRNLLYYLINRWTR